jgi:pimeloyl-ACP methyl ester carboxylesterase
MDESSGGSMKSPPATSMRVEHTIEVAGLRVHVKEKGAGPDLVVLHHSTGPLWTPFYERLTRDVTLLAIDMPGYGRSERPEDARSPRDLAILTLQAIDLLDRGPVHLLGLGLGGWVAAEMASMNRQLLQSLILVGAPGIRPEHGMIYDPMMGSYVEYNRMGFASEDRYREVHGDGEPDPELVKLWDFSREMTARIVWRPWMWSVSLPVAVAGIRVPTLIVWGEKDAVVPLECAEQYHELIRGSELRVLPGVGHTLDMEDPDDLADDVVEFVSREGG